jgi:hypothetical protein
LKKKNEKKNEMRSTACSKCVREAQIATMAKVQHPQLLCLIPAINGAKEIFSCKVCSMYVIKILLFHIYIHMKTIQW